MTTVTVWILLALSGFSASSPFSATRIATFADQTECERVKTAIDKAPRSGAQPMVCLRAEVAVLGGQS